MLTDQRIRAAKPRTKSYKLSDGQGLHLLIMPSGSRLWRFRFRHAGRESMLALGAYPEVSLRQARLDLADARKVVASGRNPAAVRKVEKTAAADTFEAVGREWLAVHQKTVGQRTYAQDQRRLEAHLFPFIGTVPVADLQAQELLAALRRISERGRHELARRVRELAGRILRYGVATNRVQFDVSTSLRGTLPAPKAGSFAALTKPAEVGALLRSIDGYLGDAPTCAALKLAPLVFVRPGELRGAEWREFDLDAAEWRIPGSRMKAGEAHLVPLSRQAVQILRDLHPVTGRDRLVFPSLRSRDRPLSENTLNAALRRLGYSTDQHTAHGFRSTFSTLANELGWNADLIELQLAHAPRDKVRAAYNRSVRIDERRKMMQDWADHLDRLRGSNVVPLNRAA